MNALLEQTIPLVAGGALLTMLCFAGWLKTGHRGLMLGAALFAILAVALLVVDQIVVTDREQVERAIDQMARDVESGDLRLVLRHVHPEADETLREASAEFPQYKIKSVRIKHGMRVDLNLKHDPPEAVAEFNVVLTGADAGNLVGESQAPRFVILRLWKDGDQWKVRDYRHMDPVAGMRNRP